MAKAKTKVLTVLVAGVLATAASLAELRAKALSYEKTCQNNPPIITLENQEQINRNDRFLKSLAVEYEFKADWKVTEKRLNNIEAYFKSAGLDDEKIRELNTSRRDQRLSLAHPYIRNSEELNSILWDSLAPSIEEFFSEQAAARPIAYESDQNQNIKTRREFHNNSIIYSEEIFGLFAKAMGLYSAYGLNKKEEERIESFFSKAKNLERRSPLHFDKLWNAIKNNIPEETLLENL